MREEIRNRFNDNIARVENLVALYRGLGGAGKGRRPVHASDVLRGATVLLHAALEEVFRSTAAWRYPALGEQLLNEIALVGIGDGGRPEKFFLGRLAAHRTKTVQQVIDESIKAHLNYFNINSTTEIAGFLRKIGLEPRAFEQFFPALDGLINRRHHIVHQADRNDHPGTGQQRARSLSVATVGDWIETTKQFVHTFIAQVPDELL